MAWPPATIAADKAPGAPSSATEHPDHHNALASAVNEIVAYLTARSWVEVEINFGTTPQYSALFTIVDGDVTAASNIVVNGSSEPATGRVGNDAEWDGLALSAIAGSGSFTLTAIAVPGPVVGARKVLYSVV